MRVTQYEVILTNGKTLYKYHITATNKQEAAMLTQAEVIKTGVEYSLVSVRELELRDENFINNKIIKIS